MSDTLKLALHIVGDDDDWSDTALWLNGYSINPVDQEGRDMLKIVAHYDPIREQLEAVRDMLVEALEMGSEVAA